MRRALVAIAVGVSFLGCSAPKLPPGLPPPEYEPPKVTAWPPPDARAEASAELPPSDAGAPEAGTGTDPAPSDAGVGDAGGAR
jgi:hypothetical protein